MATTHVEVTLKECHDNFEKMLRRFQKKVQRSGVLKEFMAHKGFMKPSLLEHHERQSAIYRAKKASKEII